MPGDWILFLIVIAAVVPAASLNLRLRGSLSGLLRSIRLETTLFITGLIIYILTRFWALASFPIYFFGDEAVQALFAQDLIARGLRGPDGALLPVYVEAAGQRWTPLLPMYFHALTLTLFGKSILVTRGTSTAVSILAVVSVAMILKQVFKLRFWWIGAFLVALTPAWFLHSRTAFETVFMTAFFGCFLWFYLLYRVRSPNFLYLAVLFGAMTFYTYSNAQLVVLAAALLLLISDFRYHLSHPKVLLGSGLLLLLLAAPLIVFRLRQPDAIAEHLRMVNTYWLQPIPFTTKVLSYLQKYASGLSPAYWFFPNQQDLVRHRMAGIGQIPAAFLPFFLGGLLICLVRMRSSPYRAVLIAALAAPAGAALVDVGIARVLIFIVPANILVALGLDWLLSKLTRWAPDKVLSLGMLILLGGANLLLLHTSLTQGPLWFHDYGLYGMQYGARQIFQDVIPTTLRQEPNTTILVSSTWANGTDNFLRFFMTSAQQKRVRMDDIDAYLFKRLPLSRDDLFIMPAAEYKKAVSSPVFTDVSLDGIIPYPDGTPGFYLARMEYSPAAEGIFAAQKAARQQLTEGWVVIGPQVVRIRYSQIDMGTPALMFDGDDFTLMRGLEANPFIIELHFPQPRVLTGLSLSFGMMNIDLTVKLYSAIGNQPEVYKTSYRKDSGKLLAEMSFDEGLPPVSWLRLELLNPDMGEGANIHIRELKLIP